MWAKTLDYDSLFFNDYDVKLIQARIIDFIISCKQRALSPATINLWVAALKKWYIQNDILTINWAKVNSYKPEFCRVVEDEAYTREQIAAMVPIADLRDKALLLLLASTGCRIGSIPKLRLKLGLASKNVISRDGVVYETFQYLASDIVKPSAAIATTITTTSPAKPSSLTILGLTLPPYFNRNNITDKLATSKLEYEFVPNVEVDFSFLATDENSRRYPLLQGKYGIFDFEWDPKKHVMLCATFSDNLGNKVAKHIEDFPVGGEDLLRWIISQIKKYVLTFGWNSTCAKNTKGDDGIDSDLAMLHKRCKYHKIPSIVEIKLTQYGKRFAVIKDPNHIHLDVYKIVVNQIMIGVNKEHGIIYSGYKLGDVGEAYGYGGKLEDLTGVDVVTKSSKEQMLKYNARDVDLTHKILQHNNYEILDLYYMISKVAKIKFALACHSGSTTYWASIIDNIGYELPVGLPMMPYQGALVFDPEHAGTIGDYQNIYSADFTSLYPWTIILNNLSPETICCECCGTDKNARVPTEIIEDINAWAATDHKPSERQASHAWRIWYWVCQKKKGLLPTLLEKYVNERLKYKKVNYALQYTIKILMNSLYGCCGTSYKYRDVRVAELTTAYARKALQTLRKIANEEFNLRELYSDTDSIFLQGIRDSEHFEEFQKICKEKLTGLELEPKLLDQFLLIDSKSYIAKYQDKGKTVIEKKGLQGLKSDASKWIKQAVEQFVNDYTTNNLAQIIPNVKKAYDNMLTGRVPRELLKIYERLDKDPSSYKSKGHYLVRLAQEQKVTQGGRIFYLYSTEEDGRPETNPKELSIDKYLEIFETAFGKLVNLVENGRYNYYNDIIGIDEAIYKHQQEAKARRKKQDPKQEALM